jgi:spore maturation protein SpmA
MVSVIGRGQQSLPGYLLEWVVGDMFGVENTITVLGLSTAQQVKVL